MLVEDILRNKCNLTTVIYKMTDKSTVNRIWTSNPWVWLIANLRVPRHPRKHSSQLKVNTEKDSSWHSKECLQMISNNELCFSIVLGRSPAFVFFIYLFSLIFFIYLRFHLWIHSDSSVILSGVSASMSISMQNYHASHCLESLSLSSAACGCWLHHWLGRDYAADAVSPLPVRVHWCSFCRPRKNDRLSQPPGVF